MVFRINFFIISCINEISKILSVASWALYTQMCWMAGPLISSTSAVSMVSVEKTLHPSENRPTALSHAESSSSASKSTSTRISSKFFSDGRFLDMTKVVWERKVFRERGLANIVRKFLSRVRFWTTIGGAEGRAEGCFRIIIIAEKFKVAWVGNS